MSGPISFDTAPIVNNAVTYVQPPFKDLTKLAIVGWDNELDNLLKALPGQPAPESLIGQKISAWIDMQKVDVAIQQVQHGVQLDIPTLETFLLDTWALAVRIPEDSLQDFHPSRLLLSATVRLDYGRAHKQPTDFSAIRRDDPALWSHPFLADEANPTRQWFMNRGRRTPVPSPLKLPLSVRSAQRGIISTPNPIIAQPRPTRPYVGIPLHMNHRIADEKSQGHQEGSMIGQAPQKREDEPMVDDTRQEHRGRTSGGPSTRTRSRSRSRSRSSRIKSQVHVTEPIDDEKSLEHMSTKGKGKAKDMDDGMEVDEVPAAHATPTPMDVDGETSTEPPLLIRIKPRSKSSSAPAASTSPLPIIPAPPHTPCQRCMRLGKECRSSPGSACATCHAAKTKCSHTRRKQEKPNRSSSPKTPKRKLKTPRQSPAPEDKGVKTPRARAKSRGRMSRPPATSSEDETTKTPRTRQRSRTRSIRAVDPLIVLGPTATRSSSPNPETHISVADLGQVPSEYVYFLSKDGQQISTGIRVQAGEDGGRLRLADERDMVIRELLESNRGLGERVMKMGDELATLKNTVTMLLAGQNGHTATLESHRVQLLAQQQPSSSRSSSRHSSLMREPSNTPVLIPAPAPTPEGLYGTDLALNAGSSTALDNFAADIFNMDAFKNSPTRRFRSHSPKELGALDADPAGVDSQMV